MNESYNSLSKNALNAIRVGSLIGWFVMLLLGGIGIYLIYTKWLPAAAYIAAGALVLCAVIGVTIVPLIKHKRYKYLIADDRIEIIEGVFFIVRTIVPIDRIYQIDISRGPVDTHFGVAKVSVVTAGSRASFRYLEVERAEEIALRLNETINEKLRRLGGGEGEA